MYINCKKGEKRELTVYVITVFNLYIHLIQRVTISTF